MSIAYRPTGFRSEKDLHSVDKNADLPEVIESINKFISNFNILTKALSLQSNFDAYVAEDVSIPAGATIKIQHFLGVTPKWRILLRQTGNGVITDVNSTPSDWNDKVISLKNNGAEIVKLSVLIARE